MSQNETKWRKVWKGLINSITKVIQNLFRIKLNIRCLTTRSRLGRIPNSQWRLAPVARAGFYLRHKLLAPSETHKSYRNQRPEILHLQTQRSSQQPQPRWRREPRRSVLPASTERGMNMPLFHERDEFPLRIQSLDLYSGAIENSRPSRSNEWIIGRGANKKMDC